MLNRKTLMVMTVLACGLGLAGCMPGGTVYSDAYPAGFFSGIWHGWIAPLSLIIGIFNGTTRVYEINNTGWWYDFGFYMAIISGFGSLSLFRRSAPEEPSEPDD